LVVLALSLVSGCSQGGGTAAARETTETAAAQEAPPAPTADDLRALALTVADLPTGGWTLAPSGTGSKGAETSTDKTPGEVCGLDFTSAFPLDAADDDTGSIFTRESLGQRFNTGVFLVEDAEQVIDDLNTALDSCSGPFMSTESGQDTRVEVEELAGGEAAIEGGSKACRQVQMVIGYTSLHGSFCFVADGDLVVSTMATGSSSSTVQPAEFAQLSNAASRKAFAAR
jgi:hypothetical protein